MKLFSIWTSVSGGKAVLKVFLNWSSGSQFVQQSVTVCAVVVESIQRYDNVKI